MTDIKNIAYNTDDFLEDPDFVNWVLKGTNNAKWKQFLEKNPGAESEIAKASEIILLLQDSYEDADQDTALSLWQNIEEFNRQENKKVRLTRTRYIIKWAAAILLLLTTGTLYYYFIQKKPSYQFQSQNNNVKTEKAKLVFSNGEEVLLTKDNSAILVDSINGKIIVNDSIINLVNQPAKNNAPSSGMNEVFVPYGKRSQLLLADGTKVWLNAGSRFAFPSKFSGKTRKVYIEGEAYFEVAKDSEHPFIVNAEALDIKVLGTHFNVTAYPSDAAETVVLFEGSVSIALNSGIRKKEVLLEPSQKAMYNDLDKTIVVSDEVEASNYIEWTKGRLEFSKSCMMTVFDNIERYYNIEIITRQGFPNSELISGKLDLKESLDDILEVLGQVAGFDYRIVDNKVYIDKKMNEIRRK